MNSTPHTTEEQKTIQADTLAALHKIAPIEAAAWDLWIERGEARLVEVPRMTDEDLGILEVAVPRGWRDFLLAYPRWKGQNPKIGDSLSEELRAMVSAEVVMLIDEIAVSRPDVAAALVEQYSLQNLDTSVRRSEKEPPVAPSTPGDTSLDETLQAIVQHAGWLADRLPVGGIVPVGGDIGIMVLEKADLEGGTPAKLCKVHQTPAGWTRTD